MAYAREAAAISKSFDVFPSTEAVLLEARVRRLRRLHLRHRQPQRRSLRPRLERGRSASPSITAVTIRKLFDGKPLVSGVKALLGHIHADPAWARVKPPLAPFSAADRAAVVAGFDQVRGKRVA